MPSTARRHGERRPGSSTPYGTWETADRPPLDVQSAEDHKPARAMIRSFHSRVAPGPETPDDPNQLAPDLRKRANAHVPHM